jgi:AcrR family transcriptional regulator
MAPRATWHPVPYVGYHHSVPSLRDTKKSATRQAIVDAAMRLFRDRPFSEVSIDEIVAAAGIGRRTFFRYFPTKEDVVLDPRLLDRGFAVAALTSAGPDEDDVDVVMRVLKELQRRTFADVRAEHQLDVHRLTHREPALAARSWLLSEAARDIIVEGLVPPDADRHRTLRARVLASACIMAMDAAITTWIEGELRDDLEALLSEAAGHVRSGFAGTIR